MRKWILGTIIASLTLLISTTILQNSGNKKTLGKDEVLETQTNQNHTASLTRNVFRLLKSRESKENSVKLRGEERDQINFLFLGVGGEEHSGGKYLTDTIILLSFVPSIKRAAVISIPRDLLVRAPDQKNFVKINALLVSRLSGDPPYRFPGPMGIQYVKTKLQEITEVPIDYFLILDLAAVEKIVDTLGGINVRRIGDLEDKNFPDKNYGYETYKIEEGWRYLDGKEAVKYIRTRHTAGGDFDRMKRQQEVALAIKKKVQGLKSLAGIPKLLSLYSTLQSHWASDLSFDEILDLRTLTEDTGNDSIIFETLTAQNNGLLVSDTVVLGGQNAYVLKPKAGLENYEEIKIKVKDTLSKLK